MKDLKTIMLNDQEYVLKEDAVQLAESVNGMKYCIIRCRNAGVHSGYVKSRDGQEVTLLKGRRLWRWWGKTLSGLATEGTFAPDKCKFADEVPEITLLDACEIIPCTQVAIDSLKGVAPWTND